MQDIALYETITQPRIVEEDLKEGFRIFRVSRALSRQSLTTKRALRAGGVLVRDDLTIKRPGFGIEPSRLGETLGRRLARSVEADVPLREEDLA